MRLLLCDDHRLFVEPLAAALARKGHDVVVAHTPARALAAVAEHRPDVVVLDLRFPQGSGLDVLGELRTRNVTCPVVILSASVDVDDLTRAARAGAAAFLRKDQPVAAILDALRRVAEGRPAPTPPVLRQRVRSAEHERVRRLVHGLTERERQVLRLLVKAEDTTEICRSLGVGASTARTHVQNVLLKLGVHTRLQAVALVVSSGMDRELSDGAGPGRTAVAPGSSPAGDVDRTASSAGRPVRPRAPTSDHARDPRTARG
jgi:two-component system nitrate/nitrite response regulator NarL